MKHDINERFARLMRTDAEYDAVVAELDRLLAQNPTEGSPAVERIEFLSLLVEDYDRKHHDLPGGDSTPQEIVEYLMDAQGLESSDLAEVMGGRSRVSEFLSGKRPLSMSQLYALRDLLHVPADLLLGDAPRSGKPLKPRRSTRSLSR